MNPVSDTAFYTCGIRAQDAESAHPVCNDTYARRFMNAHGMEVFAAFSGDRMGSKAHVARHCMIDESVRARIAADPRTCVVTIGAGFDSRAYRTDGGRWFELDEPAIVEYKNARLAAVDCPNDLTRIAIDFGAERLGDKLPRLDPEASVVVVIEGVFFYLTEAQIGETLNALRTAYPNHVLICDLMTRHLIESRYRRNHKKLEKMNAPFRFLSDDPCATFTQAGYRVSAKSSIIARAFELMWGRWIAALLARLMPGVAHGYTVFAFETVPGVSSRPA